jgi:subfamily B ATP-binding cassette protein MsbA
MTGLQLPRAVSELGERWIVRAQPLVALERICVILLVIFLLKNLADYLQAFLMVSIEQGVIRDLRSALYAHLQELSLSFFHGRRSGMLVSRVTNDMEYLRAALASSISNLVKHGLTLLGALIWVFVTSWQLALLSLLVVPPLGLTLAGVGRKMRKRSGRAQERMADMTAVLQESIAGVRVVKAFGMEGFEQARFDRANQGFYGAFVHLRRVSAAAQPLTEMAIVVVAVAMLWVGGRQIFTHQGLAPQSFMLFVGALLTTLSPIKSLAEVNANIQQGVAAAQRVFGLLDTAPAIQDRPGAVALPRLADRIRYESVSFAYQPGRPVLEDISFELRHGEVVALVGSSGAGKSTVMDLLARFYEPTSGRITLDGVDLTTATTASLRAQLGIVTQETILFHDTVRANIAYGLGGASDEAVRAAATAAHADDFIGRLPQGYDTVIGERGLKLSGGERQRLAIARALLKNPPVLLLDEATSSLDTESERLVQDALERLMHDRTVLVIAHRLSTVQHADRILVLEQGRVAESGTHAQLMERDGLYRRLYDLQFAG